MPASLISTSNQTAEALPELQKAVQLDPEVIKPHLMLAFVLDQTGKRQEAEDNGARHSRSILSRRQPLRVSATICSNATPSIDVVVAAA